MANLTAIGIMASELPSAMQSQFQGNHLVREGTDPQHLALCDQGDHEQRIAFDRARRPQTESSDFNLRGQPKGQQAP